MRDDIAEGLPPRRMDLDEDLSVPSLAVPKKEPTAMEVFFAWEKLRVAYNVILVAVTVVKLLNTKDDWGLQPLVMANVAFCVGPVAEGYLCWLGVKRPSARALLFGLGMFAAIG